MSNFNLVTIGQELFGRSLRLLVAYWIETRGEPRFFEREAALGVMAFGAAFQQGEVSKELARLVRLGMLAVEEEKGRPNRGKKFYVRTDSPLWGTIEVIADLVGNSQPTRPPTRQRKRR